MQTVLDTNLHLDRVVAIGGHAVGMHPEVFLLGYVCYATGDGHTDKISSKWSYEDCTNAIE